MPLSGSPLSSPVQLTEILSLGVKSKPDAAAVVSLSERITWCALDRVSTGLAAGYLGLGLKPGDRVASLMPNRCELLVHYLACMKCGLVAMPLNYRYAAADIDYALEVGGAEILIVHKDRVSDLSACRSINGLPLGRIIFDDTADSRTGTFQLLAETVPVTEFYHPAPKDPAIIFFTSGSTGKPKGVCHTFETLGWILSNAAEGFEMTIDDVMLPGGSLSHVGAHHLAFMTLAVGGRVVLTRTFDADELLPLMRRERPTKMWMLPSALYALMLDHNANHSDFSSLRACYSGGDKVSDSLENRFEKLAGLPINAVYGMTEIGIPGVNPIGRNRIGSAGKLTPGMQASIRDQYGKELPLGEEGSLWIKFSGKMAGYWNNPEATGEAVIDGWLDTGDVMFADEDDYLWFRGRKKQIIVHDGSNICPQEVEAILLEHDAIAEAGVVGVVDRLHGENIRAYVTLISGSTRPASQTLIQFARRRIGYKAPEEIFILDEMPLNAVGKVDRTTLKRMAISGLDSAV